MLFGGQHARFFEAIGGYNPITIKSDGRVRKYLFAKSDRIAERVRLAHTKNITEQWLFWRLINKGLCSYREIFVEDVFDFYDIYRMQEYCDRLDYDEAVQSYESEKESKKNQR